MDDRVVDEQLEKMPEWLCHLTMRYSELALTNLLVQWQSLPVSLFAWYWGKIMGRWLVIFLPVFLAMLIAAG
ncbi:MAG: hypothetical protein HC877_05005 [Thioploca sp.]|nr:hypothetical protein [Thioploca sp.]